MDSTGINSLCRLHLPQSSRILPSSCCPDKDLVVVLSRSGGKDRMSLWKMQGSKKWEVSVDSGLPSDEEVVDLAWSPDCQSIVLIHTPPRVTCHSLQTGLLQRTVPLESSNPDSTRLLGVWWFADDKKRPTSTIPDIFRRNDIVTGSSLSVLKMLPLLDALPDTSRSSGPLGVFGFTSEAKPSANNNGPTAIQSWPTLPLDSLCASIHPAKRSSEIHDDGLDEPDNTNANSILAVVDTHGHVQCFLDGTFPLGTITISDKLRVSVLYKTPDSHRFNAFHSMEMDGNTYTSILPTAVELAMLASRIPRDLAKISSVACQLLHYAVRAIDDLRSAWVGTDTQPGARDLGIKWLTKLHDLQPTVFSQTILWSKLDLLQLLSTERSTEPVSDFIGAGEQMSDRGLLKWESTVTNALVKLRDHSEQRITPACQRLHLVLEEVLGWAVRSGPFASCELEEPGVRQCLDLLNQAIMFSCWLSSVARQELGQFREFMKWLRFEINNTSSPPDHVLQPNHDVLEVRNYIVNGLIDNPIDKWFFGGFSPIPTSESSMEGKNQAESNLTDVLENVRRCLNESEREIGLQRPVSKRDLCRFDRNLHALLHDLADKCSVIFQRASKSTARSASCRVPPAPQTPGQPSGELLIREHMIVRSDTVRTTHYLAAYPRATDSTPSCLSVIRLECSERSPTKYVLSFAVLDCLLAGDDGQIGRFDIQDLEFFDDECIVLVYTEQRHGGRVGLAEVRYSELAFDVLEEGEGLNGLSREGVAWETIRRWQTGTTAGTAVDITRSYTLSAFQGGGVCLSVNGRTGRRVACVLSKTNWMLEVLDLEAEDETDEEGAEGEGE